MTYQLPEKLRTLEPYQPITGQFHVRLDANESFISLPDDIRKEIGEKVSQIDFNRYPDPYAVELCGKFADYFHVPSDLVVAANGSDELLFLLTACFSNAGDTLMMVKPDFSMYYGILAFIEKELSFLEDNLHNANDFEKIELEERLDGLKFATVCLDEAWQKRGEALK